MDESVVEEVSKSAEEVRAWIGLDWADQKHQIAECNVSTGQVTSYVVGSSGEAMQEWLLSLKCRYEGGAQSFNLSAYGLRAR